MSAQQAIRHAGHSGTLREAIVLVGGFGRRLLPLTQYRPKPLIPLANLALIDHLIERLGRAGIRHVILAMHHRAPDVLRHFLHRPCGVDLSFMAEDLPLGTAGAIRHCAPALHSARCLVVYGDIVTDLNLSGMLASHFDRHAQISMALAAVRDPSSFGVVQTDTEGRLLSLTEKPARGTAAREVNAGLFIFERAAIDRLPDHPSSFERDALPALLGEGMPVYGYRIKAGWADLGTPDSYLRAHHDVLGGKLAVALPGRETAPGIWLGDDVALADGVQLRAPVLIGNGVRIARGATVGPYTVLGHHVIIGEGARVRGSLLWDHIAVLRSSRLTDCIIGEHNQANGILQGVIRGDIAPDHRLAPQKSCRSIAPESNVTYYMSAGA